MFRTLQMFTISNIIHRTFVLGCKFMLVIYVPPITYPKVTVNELWDRWNIIHCKFFIKYKDRWYAGTLSQQDLKSIWSDFRLSFDVIKIGRYLTNWSEVKICMSCMINDHIQTNRNLFFRYDDSMAWWWIDRWTCDYKIITVHARVPFVDFATYTPETGILSIHIAICM